MSDYKPNEMMTIAAARALRNTDVCFVGIGMPSAACNLARLTHAPDITFIYESGTNGTNPDVLPRSMSAAASRRSTTRTRRRRFRPSCGRSTMGSSACPSASAAG